MSIDAISDLVEQSIRLLDNALLPSVRKRDLISAFYAVESLFDRSFTKLRVFNILVKYQYFTLFELKEHPFYTRYKKIFDAEAEKSVGFIYQDIEKGYDDGKGKLDCYWFATRYLDDDHYNIITPLNRLCCEPGTPSWYSLVARGRIKPPFDVPPANIHLLEAAEVAAQLALDKENPHLLASWYTLVPLLHTLLGPVEPDLVERLRACLLSDRAMAIMHASDATGSLRRKDELLEDYGDQLDGWYQAYHIWAERNGYDVSRSVNTIEDSLAVKFPEESKLFRTIRERLLTDATPRVLNVHEHICALTVNYADYMKEEPEGFLTPLHFLYNLVSEGVRKKQEPVAHALFHLYRGMIFLLSNNRRQCRDELVKIEQLCPGTVPLQDLQFLMSSFSDTKNSIFPPPKKKILKFPSRNRG